MINSFSCIRKSHKGIFLNLFRSMKLLNVFRISLKISVSIELLMAQQISIADSELFFFPKYFENCIVIPHSRLQHTTILLTLLLVHKKSQETFLLFSRLHSSKTQTFQMDE